MVEIENALNDLSESYYNVLGTKSEDVAKHLISEYKIGSEELISKMIIQIKQWKRNTVGSMFHDSW